jgi:hypothetical protein
VNRTYSSTAFPARHAKPLSGSRIAAHVHMRDDDEQPVHIHAGTCAQERDASRVIPVLDDDEPRSPGATLDPGHAGGKALGARRTAASRAMASIGEPGLCEDKKISAIRPSG